MVDSLTKIDDIELTLIPDEAKSEKSPTDLTEEEISEFKIRPLRHQIEAINYGLAENHSKWLLCDGMGCGKTCESIYLAETLYRRGKIRHCLIICGVDSLRSNWKSEISKFSDLPAVVLGEYVTKSGRSRYRPVGDRCEQLKNPIGEFFIIVNAATVGFDSFVEAFRKSQNDIGMIVLDECHRFATKTSNRGSNLLKLDAEYKVAMTGTLIVNSPISAYVPLSWTGNDKATLTNYKSQYCCFGGYNNSQVIGYQNLDLLREEIEGCSLRRTLDQVRDDMPEQTITTEIVEMSDEDAKFYEAVKSGVKEEADKIELNSSNLLALTTRLRQATSCPTALTSQPIVSTKLLRAAELAEDLIGSDEKVVVFACFKESVYQLESLLKQFDPVVCTGDKDPSVINGGVRRFMSDPDCKILLGTHSLMGTGFTLNAASYMICVDTPFTWSQFKQSCDRIWRVTNKRPAFITTLVAKGTIDERVMQIVNAKKELGDYLEDGRMSSGLSSMLKDIILDL